MNNEETMIMQPQGKKAEEPKNAVETPVKEEVKDPKKKGNGSVVAAATAAGITGGLAGGVGTAAAQTVMNAQTEEDIEEEVAVEDEPQPTTAAAKPEPTPEPVEPETVEVEVEEDYTNHDNADPVVEEPLAQPTSNEESGDVRILGVYEETTEEGVHEEYAVLTNGSEVAVVADLTGDGQANVLGVDADHSGSLEENEIIDISDQNIQMSDYEQAYIAQQQMEQEQQETFAYNADNQDDYNNDAPVYEA